MAPTPLQHRRTHNTLLFQKLLNLRDGASPFTLILDTLEQTSSSVVGEFVGRAKISKSQTILVSFTSPKRRVSPEIDVFIPYHNTTTSNPKTLSQLRTEVLSHLQPAQPASQTPQTQTQPSLPKKVLIIIDSLNHLSSTRPTHLPTFLSSLLLASPGISILGTYHLDIPLPPISQTQTAYEPTPLTTLTYLSTSILSLKNPHHVLLRKKAQDRSLEEPRFGLAEKREGLLISLKKGKNQRYGNGGNRVDGDDLEGKVIIEMNLRRKSGRGVIETFILSPCSTQTKPQTTPQTASTTKPTKTTTFTPSTIILLDDHPLFNTPTIPQNPNHPGNQNPGHQNPGEGVEGEDLTFKLNLSEKERRDREGIVLPYFDAQKDGGRGGPGEGGRIIYEMGEEDKDDFDDEEDEI